jgi:hypothetical protein
MHLAHPDAESDRMRRHAEPGLPVFVTRQLPPAPADPEQAQSADSTCCILQRQTSAADVTRCVKIVIHVTVSLQGGSCFSEPRLIFTDPPRSGHP